MPRQRKELRWGHRVRGDPDENRRTACLIRVGVSESDPPSPQTGVGQSRTPLTRRDQGANCWVWRHLSLTLFGQPQEQHVAVRASSPARGWSHFELVVLAPAEAAKLCALPASQQGLRPRSSLASRGRLGPEQRGVGLSRRSRATHLGESPEKGRGVRELMLSPFVSPGLAPAPGCWASPSS